MDLISAKQILLRQGSLVRAVMASCVVPGFMPAVKWGEMILVDGALVGAVPADKARIIEKAWSQTLIIDKNQLT